MIILCTCLLLFRDSLEILKGEGLFENTAFALLSGRGNDVKLASTKDVGLTLMDIATGFPDAPEREQEDTLEGASFLRARHATYRSCEDANIPSYLCLCMDEKASLSEQYDNGTVEFQQLFEYVKAEILKNECLENVTEAPEHHSLSILSLNAMVQRGVKAEEEYVCLFVYVSVVYSINL
ncbi:hypothetical protein GCK32_006328 [Trichostrongylus colubriformis]|uniref:Uncharacterized protein n=1 Tax=Trichostrongylus colubriformis TaxID=6319 RepID=A0AAN8GBP4_TRICO